MSSDPISRLPAAFGALLACLRAKRKLTVEALATATGLFPSEVARMEGVELVGGVGYTTFRWAPDSDMDSLRVKP
jgi:hypothetical protein